MDAVEYLKEKGRFCKQYKGCSQCPLYERGNCVCPDSTNPAEAVRIVEEWSKAHPIQTNGQKFQEVFGRNKHIKWCGLEWWDMPYEAPKGAE